MKNYLNTGLESKNNKGYSVIIALFTVGFMLVISTSIFNLVLNEMYDTNGLTKYFQAFNGAEGSMELGLLALKKNTYGFEDEIIHTINSGSVLLSENSTDYNQFKRNKEVYISYDLKSRTNTINRDIEPGKYFIIPLFYTDNSGVIQKVQTSINLSVSTGNEGEMGWNIVGKTMGISGVGMFDQSSIGNKKTITSGEFNFGIQSIGSFLNLSDDNYLILFNSDPNNNISFELSTTGVGEYFTRGLATIVSSGEIGKYKQNLRVDIDNGKYLNLLKYSIFSN